MKKYLIAVAVLIALAAPAGAPANPQQRGPGRGVFGKSSGGYGAITHALRYSEI